MIPVYFTDFIKECVAATQTEVLSTIKANEKRALGSTKIEVIDFQYGHKLELMETLAQMNNDPATQNRKYPCVYLVQDFTEKRIRPDYYAEAPLNIIIMHHTQVDFKITDRYAKVFKTVLYPIYYELIRQISIHPGSLVGQEEAVEHYKTDRAFWGRNTIGGEKYMLNDFVDAIELTDTLVKLNFNC